MRKIQKCKKCGRVFAVKETSGPGLGMPVMSEIGRKMCPSCLTDSVVWMEEGPERSGADADAGKWFRLLLFIGRGGAGILYQFLLFLFCIGVVSGLYLLFNL